MVFSLYIGKASMASVGECMGGLKCRSTFSVASGEGN